MRIYVVNLERSAERREAMRVQLDALGLDYEFFRAVDGKAGEHLRFKNYSEEACLRAWRRPLTPGEVGCFASHYLLWNECARLNEACVVIEDDVVVANRLVEALILLERLTFTFGVVRLSNLGERDFVPIRRSSLPDNWTVVLFAGGALGTQGYAVGPAAAARLIEQASSWVVPVDIYLNQSWRHGMPIVGLSPFQIAIRRDIPSEIRRVGVPEVKRRWRARAAREYDTLRTRLWIRQQGLE